MVFSAVSILAAAAMAVAGDAVKVSQFGYDAADSTRFVAALDSGAKKVVFDRMEGPWVVTPVWVRSNTEIVFEDGVELLAKRGEFRKVRGSCLMNVVCVSNVTIRGEGGGGRFRMWIEDYHSDDYKRSEWRHALNILSSSRVTVEKMSFLKSGGDGIYLGEEKSGVSNRDIVIRDCVCDGNNRQGISVITADGLLIERTVLSDTRGTAPRAGIDFEPNLAHQKLSRIVMRDCVTKGNMGYGYEFYLEHFDAGTAPVDVTFENCRSVGDDRGGFCLSLGKMKAGRTPPRGLVSVRGCRFESSKSEGITVVNKPADSVRLELSGCTVVDSPLKDAESDASVRLRSNTLFTPPVDDVSFGDLRIVQPCEREWFTDSHMWLRDVKALSGRVTVECGEKSRVEVIDGEWLAARFPPMKDKPDLRVTPFDPSHGWKIVDAAPGKPAKFQRFRLRFGGKAIIYADSSRRISFTGSASPLVRPSKGGGKKYDPMEVFDMKGKRVATIPMFETAEEERSFQAPKAGFYTLSWSTGKENGDVVVFSSCDAPFALSVWRDGIDVFKPNASLLVPHRAGTSHTVLCGGAGGERVNVKLSSPSGRVVREWDSLGSWAFGKLDDEEGVWRLSFSKPTKGTFEDALANIGGEVPQLFFLTDEKYWY